MAAMSATRMPLFHKMFGPLLPVFIQVPPPYAYRWTGNSKNANFTTAKGIVAAGGGMDIRLTHRLVFRVFEVQLMVAGAQVAPLLTSRASTGIAVRF
jgi:hypothetical protein